MRMRKIKRFTRVVETIVESLLWDLSNRWLKMVEGPGCTLNGEKIRSKVQKGQKVIDVRGPLTKCTVVCFIFFYAAKHGAVTCFFVFNFLNRFVCRNPNPMEMSSALFVVISTPGSTLLEKSFSCTLDLKRWGNVTCNSIHLVKNKYKVKNGTRTRVI